MIPIELEKRNEVLFAKLVAGYGICDTAEGEMLRAINRIIYRYYNDGDYWFDGYGIETCGPCERWLALHAPIDLREALEASNCTEDEDYEKALIVILEQILNHIESVKEYRPNYVDMHDVKPRYKLYQEEV